MRRSLLLILVIPLALSCASKTATPTPSPTVAILPADLANGVLTAEDVGKGWTAVKNPVPDTFQIGGRIGTETYIKNAVAQKTVSFSQDNTSGFVTNTVYSLPSVQAAEAVMTAHANQQSTWRQQRTDGGYQDGKRLGPVPNLQQLGDDTFSARFQVTIKPGKSTETTTRTVEYVAYRIGSVMSFVVAQDVGVVSFAKKQEARLVRALPT